MKITPTVFVSLAFAAGLVAGLLSGNIISPANAIQERVILIDTDAEIANKCNFNNDSARVQVLPLREELISFT